MSGEKNEKIKSLYGDRSDEPRGRMRSGEHLDSTWTLREPARKSISVDVITFDPATATLAECRSLAAALFFALSNLESHTQSSNPPGDEY